MNILKLLDNVYYKLAYQCGLVLSGVEDGYPLWLGTQEQFSSYYKQLDLRNL